jgi:hypothetical protein
MKDRQRVYVSSSSSAGCSGSISAREKGVQFFYVHSDPFLRLGLNGIKKSLGQ